MLLVKVLVSPLDKALLMLPGGAAVCALGCQPLCNSRGDLSLGKTRLQLQNLDYFYNNPIGTVCLPRCTCRPPASAYSGPYEESKRFGP